VEQNKRTILLVVLGAMVLLSGVFLLGRISKPTTATYAQEDSANYPLLAKRLFLDNPSDIRINFSPLRTELKQYFADNKLEGGLYFEYLPTGTAIRINEDFKFRAASLIKLPVAMELYKASEQGKINLDEPIELKQEWLNDGYGDLYKKGAGHKITLRELAQILLSESDNTALRAILDENKDNLTTDDLALGSLDIDFSAASDGTIDIGTRSYSSFLKCLYFACYNTKADSQEILNYLTNSEFDQRIVAGVDDPVKVAHKIGVYNTQVQSDCGIIYLENKNYSLCIMLYGNDTPVVNNHFKELSKRVFNFVKN
jgi:beta-lactamase class A